MTRKRRKAAEMRFDAIKPVPEQIAAFEESRQIADGKFAAAYRRVPMILTLLRRKTINAEEYRALAYYRDQASLADKSPVRSCCDTSSRGGHGPGVAILSAMLETGRLERELGVLLDIARAVAVDDKSLAQWCIEKFGGRERYGKGGKFVAIVPIREKEHMELARLELRAAARRIMGID